MENKEVNAEKVNNYQPVNVIVVGKDEVERSLKNIENSCDINGMTYEVLPREKAQFHSIKATSAFSTQKGIINTEKKENKDIDIEEK